MFDNTKISNHFSNWNQKFKKTASGATGGGFNSNKLKVHLKLAIPRFSMASNKKSALLKQSMREIAVLLAENPPKEEKARIKAESLIRDDYMIEAYDILSLNCELLSERIKLLQLTKDCPPDLLGCVSTLMYAAPRVDGIPELAIIRQQFINKYGKKFDERAMSNAGGVLNERVVTKLSIQPPAAYLVQTYLEKICDQFEVDWSANYKMSADQMGEPIAPPTGYSVPIANGTGLGPQFGFRAHSGMTVNGDDNNNNNDDDDEDPLPPHFPYSGSLRESASSSSRPPFNSPRGGSNNGCGGGTTLTSSATNTNRSSISRSNSSKRGDDYNYLAPAATTTSLSYSGTSAAAKSKIEEASVVVPSSAATPTKPKIDEASLMPPPAPLAPPSSVVLPPTSPSGDASVSSKNTNRSAFFSSFNNNNNDKRDDDERSRSNNNNNTNDKTPPSPSNNSRFSYDDMAARFESLKNL